MPAGRPTDYTPELATLICQRVATHTCGLIKLCSMYNDMPSKFTINLWRYKYPEFSTQYAQAKLIQADLLAEECLDIADDSSFDTASNDEGFEICNTEYINRCRLRIDTRKWLAAKLLPRAYGDKSKEESKDESLSLLEKIISGQIQIK